MKKTQKTFFIDNLKEELKEAKAFCLVDFSGLNISLLDRLKKELKEKGAKFVVSKNTLFRIASQRAKLPKEIVSEENIKGQNALVISEKDPISFLSTLFKYEKEYEMPKPKAGVIEGFYQDRKELEDLSRLGSKENLYGSLIANINFSLSRLIYTLNQPLLSLLFVLNKAKEKEVN